MARNLVAWFPDGCNRWKRTKPAESIQEPWPKEKEDKHDFGHQSHKNYLIEIKHPDMTSLRLLLFAAMLAPIALLAQPCDPSIAPSGLSSTYTPGVGALLQWSAVPSSIGMQIKATTPSGSMVTRRLMGGVLDQYLVPDAAISPGVYTWEVQAACSTTPPYGVSLISAQDTFTVVGGTSCPAIVTDVDGNVYNTVQIGSQCWMQENLKVEHFRNGDNIPTGLGSSAWSTTTSAAFAVYDSVPANKGIYGLLYNWFTVSDTRGMCPTDWHVPKDGEWTQLTDFLGGTVIAGRKMKTTGTLDAGTGLWQSPNSGVNSSGFSGLPGGYRKVFGNYNWLGKKGYWWSASQFSPTLAWRREIDHDNTFVNRNYSDKERGYSVRCVQDE